MANFIQAVTKFGPRIDYGELVDPEEFAQRLADTTGQRRGEILRVLMEIEETIVFYNRKGRAVVVPGMGVFRPLLRGDGTLRLGFRPAQRIIKRLRVMDLFAGKVINRENIGLEPEGFKLLWDAEFPDDPLDPPRLRSA